MAVILETIGSFVLALMITASVLRLQFLASYGDSKAKTTYLMQIYAENMRRDLRTAFSKIGYDVEDKTTSIVTCTSTALTFRTDFNSDGQTELNYLTVSNLPTGTTPRLIGDQIVRLTLNGRTRVISCPGLTGLQFTYYTKNMATTNVASSVRLVHFKFAVKSTEPVSIENGSPVYAIAWAEDRVFLKNLLTKY
jgi:hypothetical protein